MHQADVEIKSKMARISKSSDFGEEIPELRRFESSCVFVCGG